MYHNVSHPYSLVQRSRDFRHLRRLVLYIYCMNSVLSPSRQSELVPVIWTCAVNRLCLVAIPDQQVKVILVYRNAHHAKSSPGNETFLHGMTVHHLWVANFLAFLLWKSLCLAASIDGVWVTPYSLQMNSSTEERMFSVIIPTPTSASKPGLSKDTFLAVSWCVPV